MSLKSWCMWDILFPSRYAGDSFFLLLIFFNVLYSLTTYLPITLSSENLPWKKPHCTINVQKKIDAQSWTVGLKSRIHSFCFCKDFILQQTLKTMHLMVQTVTIFELKQRRNTHIHINTYMAPSNLFFFFSSRFSMCYILFSFIQPPSKCCICSQEICSTITHQLSH